MTNIPTPHAQSIRFRFGLKGRRWGVMGPVVLLVAGAAAQATALVQELVAGGRQVLALDESAGSPLELAMAIAEAGVEIGNVESVVGEGTGAAAILMALTRGLHAERVALMSPPRGVTLGEGLDDPNMRLLVASRSEGGALADFLLDRAAPDTPGRRH